MKCKACQRPIKNAFLTREDEIVCGECYLTHATREDVADTLDAIQIETAHAARLALAAMPAAGGRIN